MDESRIDLRAFTWNSVLASYSLVSSCSEFDTIHNQQKVAVFCN